MIGGKYQAVRAVQSSPIISREGNFLGVLSTYFRKPHRFSGSELEMLDRRAALMIQRFKAD